MPSDAVARWDMLSNDQQVLWAVATLERRGEKVWKGKLKDFLWCLNPNSMSKSVDKLLDMNMLDAVWEQIGSKWTRVLCTHSDECVIAVVGNLLAHYQMPDRPPEAVQEQT